MFYFGPDQMNQANRTTSVNTHMLYIHLETSCLVLAHLLQWHFKRLKCLNAVFGLIWVVSMFVILPSSRCLFLSPCVRSLLIHSLLCGISNKSKKLSECRTEPSLRLSSLSLHFSSLKHDWCTFKERGSRSVETNKQTERKKLYIENEKERRMKED